MKCAIIINSLSGNSEAVEAKDLIVVFAEGYDTTIIHIYEDTVLGDLSVFDKIVVCGGDGTLHNIINKKLSPTVQLVYLPFGTFNESEFSVDQGQPRRTEWGKAGKKYFSYVCAAGIFTPLGYIVSSKEKKRWKKLAYFSKILKEYRVHRINAKFEINDESFQGEYSLLMAIDSRQCFGFKFNKMFEPDDGMMHFLAIKAPKHNGLLGRISLFFPLFRTFFIGYRKPHHSKSVLFVPCQRVNMTLPQPVAFDMDGERVDMTGSFTIKIERRKNLVTIYTQSKYQQLLAEKRKI